ncbi:hypothetical protein FF125_19925 [Aureibaculum algae]|uniref:DUF4595 domain-containing protein n=1 Tax=Aureibaculum algae TaxID=2584122 RepID=A0A5B7TUT6_9FLAO|nr:hypothetical protein [Aureibaculum algae]QCX40595.1 hypothetical protein FF125_19925 [Aureibaculum algae]
MIKSIYFLLLILLNTITFSCSSEDNSESEEIELTQNKLVKIEKVNDTFKANYTYNSENRLKNWTGTQPNFSYEIELVYDANKKIIENHYQETGSRTYTSDTYFKYNNDNNLISYDDVNLTYNGHVITATGTIEGHQNATIELETNNVGLITKLTENDNYTVFDYNLDGNLTIAKNYNNNDILLSTYTIEYDQNINPFYGQMKSIYVERFIEFFYPFEGIYIGGFEGYSFPFQKNNIISISENSTEFVSYNYTYDTENYPLNVNENYSTDIYEFNIAYYD